MAVRVPHVTDHDPAYGEVVEVAPGIRRVTARNPSKYTFHGTGTYIVGRGRVAVIDAGPRHDAHVAALLRALDGETVTHLLVTHTHGDHSPATAALREAFGARTYGFGPHPATASEEGEGDAPAGPDHAADADEAGAGAATEDDAGRARHGSDLEFLPDETVADGDVIDGDGFAFACLHTPGHISNHVCYGLVGTGALFTGDHVMGWSTTVVPPPDGDMDDYVANLERLLARDDEVLWPTHGPPVRDPRTYVAALVAHRRDREQQILQHLALGPTTIPAMVRVLYADVREELHRPAARSVLAHLLALERRGVVASEPGASEPADGAEGADGAVLYRRSGG